MDSEGAAANAGCQSAAWLLSQLCFVSLAGSKLRCAPDSAQEVADRAAQVEKILMQMWWTSRLRPGSTSDPATTDASTSSGGRLESAWSGMPPRQVILSPDECHDFWLRLINRAAPEHINQAQWVSVGQCVWGSGGGLHITLLLPKEMASSVYCPARYNICC